ncbi:MAG: MotA/TolQ/ExbB proton channel family protein [Spirochaetota bacterium]
MNYVAGFTAALCATASLFAQDGSGVNGNGNLFQTVQQGGPLMIVLVGLALVALTIIIERLIFFTRNGAWGAKRINAVFDESVAKNTHVYREELESALQTDLAVYSSSLERGLPLLSGIGNLSPIVGFLGTVIGMISAFGSIAAATTVNAKVVAVGIQIALVTTAGGLLVAAPALCAYYLFAHVVQCRISEAEERITDLTCDMDSALTVLDKEDHKNAAAV